MSTKRVGKVPVRWNALKGIRRSYHPTSSRKSSYSWFVMHFGHGTRLWVSTWKRTNATSPRRSFVKWPNWWSWWPKQLILKYAFRSRRRQKRNACGSCCAWRVRQMITPRWSSLTTEIRVDLIILVSQWPVATLQIAQVLLKKANSNPTMEYKWSKRIKNNASKT